jgi:gamma-glutamylcyclotransferase
MQKRIGGEPKVIGAAWLENHRLGFTILSKTWKGGVADIVPEVGSKVWGAIYELTEQQLEKIDHYEGYKKDRDPKKNFYNQMHVEVVDKKGVKQPCLTYQAKVEDEKRRKYLYHRPSEEYYEVIRKGGEEHELPKEFFEHLKTTSITQRNPVAMRMNDTSGMVILNPEEAGKRSRPSLKERLKQIRLKHSPKKS